MLLAYDTGNTTIAVGVFRDGKLDKSWKVKTDKDKTSDEYGIVLLNLFRMSDLETEKWEGAIISSVVPPLTPVFQEMNRDLFRVEPMVVGPGLKTGLPILYENPQEVGADRVVSAVAAFEKYGGPLIVVDFGTATTFDAISEKGEYLGGAIAPGIQISAEALYLKTARLPRIEIRKPKRAVGRTTVASMQSGLYFGYVGLVSNTISEMQNELGKETKVIATGGFAGRIWTEVHSISAYEPDLILEGLKIIYERNKSV